MSSPELMDDSIPSALDVTADDKENSQTSATTTVGDVSLPSDMSSVRFSCILFTDNTDESPPIWFSMRPCAERRVIRQLVEEGGGRMFCTNAYHIRSRNLVTNDHNVEECRQSNRNYFYVSYVYDSCRANQLMSLDDYRVVPKKMTTTVQQSGEDEAVVNEDTPVDDVPEFPTPAKTVTNDTDSADRAIDVQILQFIIDRKAYADIGGHNLWRKVNDSGVCFGDDFESTKDRFFSHIMPNIEDYVTNEGIDQSAKHRFLKYYDFYNTNDLKRNNNNNNIKSYEKVAKKVYESSVESNESGDDSDDQQMPEMQMNDNIDDEIEANEEEKKDNEKMSKTVLKPTNQSTSQTKIDNQKNNEDITDESDLDFNEDFEEEDKGSVGQSSQNVAKTQKPQNFNAYLEFIKERERTTTPENMQRIKDALKVSKKSNKTQTTQPQQQLKSMTFGQKILQKSLDEKRRESGSQESGDKVSDISSADESSAIETTTTTPMAVTKSKVLKKRSGADDKALSKRMKHNSLYNLTEDEAIVEFVLKSRRLDELKGNTLWEVAEEKDICEGRSWQSMKERFRKHIMPDIDSFDMNDKDKQRLKRYYYSENDSMSAKLPVGAYTDEEDKKILKYIINKKGYELVKGKRFWMDMENEFKNSKPFRSWQSLKERYIKRIIPNLNKYDVNADIARQMLTAVTSLSSTQRVAIVNKCKKSKNVPKRPLTVCSDKRVLDDKSDHLANLSLVSTEDLSAADKQPSVLVQKLSDLPNKSLTSLKSKSSAKKAPISVKQSAIKKAPKRTTVTGVQEPIKQTDMLSRLRKRVKK